MELINALVKFKDNSEQGRAVMQESLQAIVLLLSPIVPHITHELWQVLGQDSSLLDQAWPKTDESALVKDSLQIIVQVNGKLRGRIELAPGSDEEQAMAGAMAEQNVTRHMEGKDIRKVIHIPDRLLNIVVG